MRQILRFVLMVICTILCGGFVFTTKDPFQTTVVAMLYATFMEVMLPEKEK